MSKFVKEIIEDLKYNPETFKDYKGQGVEKGNIIIKDYGNTRVLSVVDFIINGQDMPTTYIDRWKLEVAIQNWYASVSLKVLSVI